MSKPKYRLVEQLQNKSPNEDLNEGLITRSMLHPQLPGPDVFSEAMRLTSNYRDFSDPENNYSILAAYSSIYQKVTTERIKVIKEVDKMKSFYLVDVVLGQLTEDALSPEIGTDQILEIKYPTNKKIEKVLQELEKKLKIDQTLLNITPDLLAYGEYTLETVIDKERVEETEDELNNKKLHKKISGKGLIAIRDTVEQDRIVELSQDNENRGYLSMDDRGRVLKRDAADFIKFILGGNRVRVKLEDQIPFKLNKHNPKVLELLKSLPRFVRVGKSKIYPFISKFKELELLEKLIPATKLSKLSNVNLVGMQVPGQFDIEKGLNAAKRVESIVNNKVGVDQKLGEITVESILAVAGRTKVVPLFGDKGTLDKLDFKSDEPDDLLGSTKDVRELILDSIGVPYELIYKSEGDSKSETLKRYARYLRLLKNIQRALADGVKQICCIHLSNLGIEDYDEDAIEVEFLNKLIEIDNLDKLEHADVTIGLLRNIRDFFNEMNEEGSAFAGAIDLNVVGEYLNRQLRTIGLADAIKTSKEGGPDLNIKPEPEPEEVVPPTDEPDTEEEENDDTK